MTMQFMADAEVFEEFFRLVSELPCDCEECRVNLLLAMAQSGFKITVMHTNRTPEQVVQDYAKHGDVLYIKSEETNEDSSENSGQN